MLLTPNHHWIPVAYFGIVGSSRIFSAANPLYTVGEVEYQIKNTGTRLIMVHPDMVATAVAAAKCAGLSKDNVFLLSDTACPPIDGIQDWREGLASSDVDAESWQWDPMEETSTTNIAAINYSSRTTGLPKGVMVSHYNILANLAQMIFQRNINVPWTPENRPAERWLGFLPLYHAYGQLVCLLMAAHLHVPVYVMKQFVYEDFLRNIQDFEITHLQLVPPIFIMIEKRPETSKYDLSSVRNIIVGAAPLKKELQNSVAKKLDCTVAQGYGMTEVTTGAIAPRGQDHDDSGSVGVLVPNQQCKLVDEEGNEVKEGDPGEILIRGPNVCLGYWKNDQATAETIQDGWLRTGDIAIAKGDEFWIVDRKKELIKVNGLQVAPAELEGILVEHDSIADAAVTGIYLDDQEWPRAYVALKDEAKGKLGEKQIQDWLKTRVAKHKQLVGGIKFVDEVPKLASGKIQRKVMREWSKRDAQELEKGGRPRL